MRAVQKHPAPVTKWHELAHLLTLTDQLADSSYDSHSQKRFRSPEEALMKVIAGHFGFYSAIVKRNISGTISFDAIEGLWQKLCPEASQQSALIGIVKAWPQPCLLINARLAKKRGYARQTDLFGKKDCEDSLRAVHVDGE